MHSAFLQNVWTVVHCLLITNLEPRNKGIVIYVKYQEGVLLPRLMLKEERKMSRQQNEWLDQAVIKKNETGSELIRIASMTLMAEMLIPSTISKFKKKSPNSRLFVSSRQSSAV